MGTSASLFNVSRLLVTIARLRDVVSVRSKSSTERTTYLSRLDPMGPVCYILYSGSCEMSAHERTTLPIGLVYVATYPSICDVLTYSAAFPRYQE